MRGRPVENKWIGQRIADPEIDIAGMARAQGALGFGPVARAPTLIEALATAIAAVEAGGVAVVDVRVEPGYTPAMAAAVARSADCPGPAMSVQRRASEALRAARCYRDRRAAARWSRTSSSISRRPKASLTAVDRVSFAVAQGEFVSP